jgi:hypothetical protein
MLETTPLVTVADLLSRNIRFTPDEALAIVCEVCHLTSRLRRDDGVVFLPRFDEIRLDLSGSVLPGETEPLSEAEAIRRIAELLERILPPVGCDIRVPAPVRYAGARARADLDVPPYRTVDELAAALGRFRICDPKATLRTLVARSQGETADAGPQRDAEAELTVSDLRRWRRAASRVSLQHMAYRIGVPHSLLRDLEWGYFENWPSGAFAERCLRAYAREARIDPAVVLRVVLPQLPAEDRQPATFAAPARRSWSPAFRYAAVGACLFLAIVGRSPAPDTALPPPAPAPIKAVTFTRMQLPALVVQATPPAASTALLEARRTGSNGRARVRTPQTRRARATLAPKWARGLGRLLAGDGRHKVRPVPRPSAAGG